MWPDAVRCSRQSIMFEITERELELHVSLAPQVQHANQ